MAAIEKILTDNPYLDELIYYIKILAANCILKNEQEAVDAETQESRTDSGIYLACMSGTASVYTLTFTQAILESAGLDAESIELVLTNKLNLLDETKFNPVQRQHVIDVAAADFIANYVEKNNYYRMLNGKPDMGASGIKVTDWTPPSGVVIDLTKNVHEMTFNELEILNQYGITEKLIAAYPDAKYLRHLPPKSVGYYEARRSGNFEVLYLPTIESVEIYDRFKDKLYLNKDYILRTMYSEAYKFESTYYDSMMMILIVIQSMVDCISEIQEMIANKEVLDLRCIQYIFDSYGVPFYSEIPIKFQKRLVKNLNSLLKYKSTSKNMLDILELFGFSNVEAYKYYLLKNRKMDDNGNFLFYTKNGTEELGYTTNWKANQQTMLTGRRGHAGVGDSGSAVLITKGDKGYDRNSPAPVYTDILDTTEIFNGDSWVVGAVANNRGTYVAGIGTTLNASVAGGHSKLNDLYADDFMELFNGVTWSISEATMITPRFMHTMCGIVNSALVIGGIKRNGDVIDSVELFNGTTWAAGGNLDSVRFVSASAGISTDAMVIAGCSAQDTSLSTTASYNGTVWSAAPSIPMTLFSHSAIGTTDDLLITGGSITDSISRSTYLFNGEEWSSQTNMTSQRTEHSTSGSTINAMSAGGYNNEYLNTCETRLREMSYNQIEDLNRNYELVFVKVPIDNDNPDDYLKDSASYYNYDDITSADPTWDGGLPHSMVKDKLLGETFNYARTKYISIDTSYNVTQLAFQTPYFFNMIFDDVLVEEGLTLDIPSLSDSKKFKLTDTIIFLMGLAYEHNHSNPGSFVEPEANKRVLAFNFQANMTEIEAAINAFGFTMEDVGLRKNGKLQFIIPDSSIVSFDKLLEIFDQDGIIFAMIVERMLKASNINEYRTYEYLYNNLMTIPHTNNYFRDDNGDLYSNFMTMLQNRDSILYGYLYEVDNISDANTKIQTITNLITVCITALESFIDGDKYKYVYSMVPGSSAGSVKTYVYKIINFFKSYKVDFMGLSNIYKFDDKMDATIKMIDGLTISPTFIKSDTIDTEDVLRSMKVTTEKTENVELKEYFYITRTYETADG